MREWVGAGSGAERRAGGAVWRERSDQLLVATLEAADSVPGARSGATERRAGRRERSDRSPSVEPSTIEGSVVVVVGCLYWTGAGVGVVRVFTGV